ncbi:MAG: Rne/Rng family ribonuclease [Thermoanaerobaculia bacterium]
MTRDLLVNVTPPETRVALREEGRAVEVFHERRGREGLVGNVYLGRVHRVLPGMQAAFVSIGFDRDAFLYVEDALPHPVDLEFAEEEEGNSGPRPVAEAGRPRIDDLVKEGQQLVVQVTKDPIAGKGPRVTASVSLAGRTLVSLLSVRQIGISRRITDEVERERLRRILEGFGSAGGFIARTAAAGASEAELSADREYLAGIAERIARKAEGGGAPALLHRELALPERVFRDLVTADFEAIRVDEEATAARLRALALEVVPALAPRIEEYRGPEPIFQRFGVEAEIEEALGSRVALPSGGSCVIHQTEALVAIDVNTGRFTGREDLEQTVFATNLEAIPEIARQIRLRDLGGLLVVDFIDMQDPEHRSELFERFQRELARDRARTRVLQISEFGLVEITRQRSRNNLERVLTRPCPDCSGTGRVKTDLTAALDLRRALLKPPILYAAGDTIRVRVPASLAELIGQEAELLEEVRTLLGVQIELERDDTLPPGQFEVLPG